MILSLTTWYTLEETRLLKAAILENLQLNNGWIHTILQHIYNYQYITEKDKKLSGEQFHLSKKPYIGQTNKSIYHLTPMTSSNGGEAAKMLTAWQAEKIQLFFPIMILHI